MTLQLATSFGISVINKRYFIYLALDDIFLDF
jgi:hypothetical protein